MKKNIMRCEISQIKQDSTPEHYTGLSSESNKLSPSSSDQRYPFANDHHSWMDSVLLTFYQRRGKND